MFFFFSSRRRHTRYIGDWSSDVCSSDLWCLDNLVAVQRRQEPPGRLGLAVRDHHVVVLERVARAGRARHHAAPWVVRSEERRVGKECRWRWWADVDKDKQRVSGT